MAFSESTVLPFSVEEVVNALSSEEFNRAVTEELGGSLTSFSKDGDTVSMGRTVPTGKLPDLAKKFVKGEVSMSQEETWAAADQDGARASQLTVKVPAAKVAAEVVEKVSPHAEGCELAVSGEVSSSIPMLGSKIASTAEPMVGRVLNRQARELKQYLSN